VFSTLSVSNNNSGKFTAAPVKHVQVVFCIVDIYFLYLHILQEKVMLNSTS